MNKKTFAFLSAIFFCLLLLTSCLFDSDESSLSSWLSDQGLPDSYSVETLEINNLNVLSSRTFLDSVPRSANVNAVLGHQANMNHDLVFEFAFVDSAFFADLKKSEAPASLIALYYLHSFYGSKKLPSGMLPIKEELNIKVSWKLDAGDNEAFVDSVGDVSDSSWYNSLLSWKADGSADTTYSMSLRAKDSLILLNLPKALTDDLKKMKKACHLQLRLSIPEASHLYRFNGAETKFAPILQIKTVSDTNYKEMYPYRMAGVVTNEETCSDCVVLHGGAFDSMVVELPASRIMEALSEFYGDEFPYTEGDGFDVRQAVILAELIFARDDSNGESELGLPIQVVVGSFVDSLGKEVLKRENYKVNRKLVNASGHPNLVFFDGETLTLQTTYGLRDFINRAHDGRNFKMMMRLGFPMLAPMDSLYMDYYSKDTKDTVYRFFDYFDYARYDFTSMMNKPATLKLWLATKRGDE